ncbi:MAG: lipoprotein signal peptidase [Saprospiraceae bacterium]
MKRSYQVALVIALVLLLDQALKFYIKTNFYYNQDVPILGLDWARLHFVENEGMAFGITFGWEYGKLLLSIFRILMVTALIWYIRLLVQADAPTGFLHSVGLITAGALGNIIDSVFYGLIFTASAYHDPTPAQLTAIGEGYGTFLHGKVVDMLYFPMAWIHMPDWLPWIGGEEYLFFSPIFNIADASITIGVVSILLFQRRFFNEGMTHHPEGDIEPLAVEGEMPPETSTAEVPQDSEKIEDGPVSETPPGDPAIKTDQA